MQPITNQSCCFEPMLGVLFACVLTNYGGVPFKAVSIDQRQAMLVEVAFAFGTVEFVVQFILLYKQKITVSSERGMKNREEKGGGKKPVLKTI